jgi:hypothetical protein
LVGKLLVTTPKLHSMANDMTRFDELCSQRT